MGTGDASGDLADVIGLSQRPTRWLSLFPGALVGRAQPPVLGGAAEPVSGSGDRLRRPVFPQRRNPVPLEDKHRNLPHPLADALRQVIELRFPLGDRGIAVEVQAQQATRDIRLGLDHLGPPVRPDAVPVGDRISHHPLVIRGPLGEDGQDQILVLCLPRLDVDVYHLADVLLGQPHCQSPLTLTICRSVCLISTRSAASAITWSIGLYAPGISSRNASERPHSMPSMAASSCSRVNVSRATRRLKFRPAPCGEELSDSLFPSPSTTYDAVPIDPGIRPGLPTLASMAPLRDSQTCCPLRDRPPRAQDRKSTRLNSSHL